MIKIPSVTELAKAGVHLGHRTTKRHPNMDPYIYGIKNTIHVIDLEKTTEELTKALQFIIEKISEGATILFVGTKAPAKDIVKTQAEKLKVPYVVERWLGGTLTNFQTIIKLIEKFNKMVSDKEGEALEKYTKKERHELDKELHRLEIMVGGIRTLTKKPDLLYIIDIGNEKTAIRETRRLNIPVVGVVDTNANPELVNWPIPANDDAIKSIELITKLVAEAIEEGRKKTKIKEKGETKEKQEKKITTKKDKK
ncbi:30S ribosomal protein S2 [Patescibacteria group bacterium AH-259-L05]|nr:30S ribosomal protein S2 [Patescibacteria group bacterium AH-259-L05]